MPPSTRSPQPLKAVLAIRDIRSVDFAKQLGCSAHHVSQVANGRVRPSARFAARCSEFLGVPVEHLFVDDPDDVVLQFVRRTTSASGVPERLEDVTAVEHVAAILGGTS